MGDQWKKSAYEYERGRCIREYTDDDIAETFKAFTKDDIETLMSFPSLFVYESGINTPAMIGWLTRIKANAHFVRLEYEIEKDLPLISPAKVKRLMSELDITNWEL